MKRIISTLMSMMIMTVTSFAQNQTVTPSTLWQMGRVGLCCTTADGNTALYSVTRYDVDANKGTTTLYTLNTTTGTTTAVTDGKISAQGVGFTPSGKIIYISEGQLWTVGTDGRSATKVSDVAGGISDAKISSDGSKIVFTADVKIKQTPSEIYPQYPKANVRIMDDLMYRHWNYWVGDAVSHVFFASFDGEKVTGTPVDIMEGELFESPLSPFGGMEQIAISPKSDKIAYTCKKKTGTAAATSTDSDIYVYDIATKKTIDITEGNKGYDTNPSWSADGRFIAFSSMDEDGYEADKNDIKLYEFANGKTYNLT
ncbi:MAG: hypothetical protein PHD21_03395, partial [Flavobacteriales bacterium]|nr:hypothetical protein [Flavobacteriales bacterium]